MFNPAYCCQFDRTGRFVVSGADDYNLKIWAVESGLLVRTCKGHKGYITYITISPDNSLIASACTEGTIRIWQFRTGRCLSRLAHGEGGEITWLQFEQSSCALSSSGSNGKCIVWDLSQLPPEPELVPLLKIAAERVDRAWLSH